MKKHENISSSYIKATRNILFRSLHIEKKIKSPKSSRLWNKDIYSEEQKVLGGNEVLPTNNYRN